MKKITMMIGLLMIVISSYSQIGKTYSETKKNLSDQERVTSERIGNISILINHLEDVNVYYFFNKEKVCYTMAYKPKSEKALNDLIREFNEKYQIKNKKWYGKLDTLETLVIELKKDPDYGRVFACSTL